MPQRLLEKLLVFFFFQNWINLYPLDSAIGFPNTYPLDNSFSGGCRYPAFQQLGPERHTVIFKAL